LVSEASELEVGSEVNAAQLLRKREHELEQKCEEMDLLQHQLDAAKAVSISITMILAFFLPLHGHLQDMTQEIKNGKNKLNVFFSTSICNRSFNQCIFL
jgi:hypothetical protein